MASCLTLSPKFVCLNFGCSEGRNPSSAMQAASDVNSPVSGEVSEVNSSLTDESSKVKVLLGQSRFCGA